MKPLIFHVNREQYAELEGLAYWIADSQYIQERYGDDEPELERVKESIDLTFDSLERLQVPIWVQNAVVTFSADWRQYKRKYLRTYLTGRGIILSA